MPMVRTSLRDSVSTLWISRAIGVETSAAAVAGLFTDILDGWLVDLADSDAVARVEATGVRCRSLPLLMRDPAATAAMAHAALDLAESLR